MDIEQLRAYCNGLKGTTEDIKWDNDLVFSIGSKMYCVAALDGPFSCSFKVADEEYEALSQQPGFEPAPYMARAKWVKVNDPGRMNKKEWERRIRESYELVADRLTKKLRSEIGI